MGNIRIPDGTAATIPTEILRELRVLWVDPVNMVGLGSDGASVMFGAHNGVGKLLLKDAPQLTHIHCVAHRLALACSDSAKDIPYLKTYRDTLRNLYVHVNGSGVRTYKLEALQEVMQEPNLKLKDPISIRWLAMKSAVSVIHRYDGSIVAYLQSNEGKNTIGDNIADGLLKEVLHYKFPAFTAFLCDVLSIVGTLCRQLQTDSLDLSQLDAMRESAIGKLQGLNNVHGSNTVDFLSGLSNTGTKVFYKGIQLSHSNEKSQMDKLKKEYTDSVTENLNNRLKNDTTLILNAFGVLEPKTVDTVSESESAEHLNMLASKYDIDIKALSREFSGVKPLMCGTYTMKNFKEFSRVFLRRHKEEYPLISQLMNIALCIPMSSVVCERGFSLQNRIKVKSRTALTPANLDTLMKLAMGPDVQDFPYEQAIRHWKAEKKRRLARLYEPRAGN